MRVAAPRAAAPRNADAAGAEPLTFEAGGRALAFHTQDAGARAWVEEFLRPWLPAAPARPVDHAVHLVADPEALRCVEASRPSATRAMPCFGLDAGAIERPAWPTPEGLVVDAADFGCHFRVEGARTRVFARPGDRRPRVVVARILRELAAAALAPDHRALHAAAIAWKGRILLIAGPRRHGKTSLLVHLLLATDAAFVANDWVWLRAREDGCEALGMPTLVAVRPDTVTRFPRLLAGRPANGSFLPYTLAEIASGLADGAVSPRGDALHLSPRQLAARTGSDTARGGALAAIVLPVIEPAAGTLRLERVHPAAAAPLLRACQHGSGSAVSGSTLFGQRDGAAPERASGHRSHAAPRRTRGHRGEAAPSWDAIAARVPLFRCRLGPDAYHGTGLVQALAEALA